MGDDELLELFRQEAAERLERMAADLIELERAAGPRRTELVASLFREAHTVKGAAAVVGLGDVTRIAHALEDVLEDLRAERRPLTPALADAVLHAVDGLREAVAAAVGGAPPVDVVTVIDRLVAAAAGATSTSAAAAPAASTTDVVLADPEPAGGERATTPPVDTVRVPVARLDELVRLVGEAAAAHLRLRQGLTDRVGAGVDGGPGALATMAEVHDLGRSLATLQEQAMRTRMVPVATIVEPLRRAVRDLGRSLGKEVRFEVRGEDTELDRNVLEQLGDPLLHLIRNAMDHGIEPVRDRLAAGKQRHGTIRLDALQLGSEVTLAVSDDGRGIDVDRVRAQAAAGRIDVSAMGDDEIVDLVFRSGLSTAVAVTDVSGRGIGLDVVADRLSAVRGRVEVRTAVGRGTELRLTVPITLAVLPCLLVETAAVRVALPMHTVLSALRPGPGEVLSAEGRPTLRLGDGVVPVSDLGAVLDLRPATHEPLAAGGGEGAAVVLAGLTRREAFVVDRLLGQRDVVVTGLGRLLPRLEVIAGACPEPDGSVLLVLDANGLIERARRQRDAGGGRAAPAVRPISPPSRARLLVVDDALTVRELQRAILERAGYEVTVASDGLEALARLAERPVDLVISDVEMPNLDGFGLVEAIRGQDRLRGIAVVLLTSRAAAADRRRGLDVGADAYVVKSAFDEGALLALVAQLLGVGS